MTESSPSPKSSSLPLTSGHDLPQPQLLSEGDLRRRVTRLRYDSTSGQLIQYPSLVTENDIPAWTHRLEMDFKSRDIPKAQWSDAAILFLEGGMNIAMRQRRQAKRNLGVATWEWEEFLVALREVLAELNAPSRFQQFREDNPNAVKIAGTGLMVVGSVAVTPLVVVGGLNALGFTAAGVAGGSIAAGAQSIFYGGLTSGLFSACQSVGATAAVPAVFSMVSAAGSLAASAAIFGSRRADDSSNGNSGNENGDSGKEKGDSGKEKGDSGKEKGDSEKEKGDPGNENGDSGNDQGNKPPAPFPSPSE